jgi:branched-chain amino acid transport system substrate-binding protein
MRTLTLLATLAMLSGCSLIAGPSLEECSASKQCPEGKVCTAEGFCVPQPDGCFKRYGSEASDAITLGALMPLSVSTEPGASLDESDMQALNAALLALIEANQYRTGRRAFTVLMCDTAGDVIRTEAQARWLANDRKVAAILTAGSGQTRTAATVAVPKDVLVMSYSASSPALTRLPEASNNSVRLLWRTSSSDVTQGRVIANLLLNDSRFGTPQRVGILFVNDAYGQGLNTVIVEQLTAAGRDYRSISYERRQADVSGLISQLNTYDPDITVLIGFNDDATRLIKAASRQSNLARSSHRWFFTDSVKDANLLTDDEVRNEVDGTYGTGPAQGAGVAYGLFRNSFLTRYNADPNLYAYTANAYDAMFLLTVAAAHADASGDVRGPKMVEALGRVSSSTARSYQLTPANFTTIVSELNAGGSVNVEGASGKLDFDANGESAAPIELWQVQGSTFRTVSIIEPTP